MAASSLLALIDDIASVLDDVALLTKAATRKTAGVLGDDLALNAQQVAGVKADRELPVVWAVATGSLVNKAILVPSALAISALAPWAVIPLLMLGGLFLCYEGVEKIVHKLSPHPAEDAAHQAFLKIWKNAHRFDAAKGKASTWLTIVARHAALDCRPREMKSLPEDLEAPRMDETYVHPRLRQALAALPEVHRNAVVLMYVYGLTHSELAERMQAPLGTVKSWVRRGTAALKETLTG